MTRDKLIALWPVLEAFKNGETIQENTNTGWVDIREIFNPVYEPRVYRIKPRTVEVTRETLAEAWDATSADLSACCNSQFSPFLKRLCERLGL